MERKLYGELLRWKSDPDCVLVIRGARQVGKTYLIREFSKEYGRSLYLNLEDEPEVRSIFENSRNADSIYLGLSVMKGFSVSLGEERPLLMIDEIQCCEEAFSALKSLYTDGRCDIIASGSLMGVRIHGRTLSPAGYVRYVDMHPMDFEEFMWAMGTGKDSTESIRRMISEEDMPDSIRRPVEDAFSRYMMIGGMPAAVDAFARTGDYTRVWDIHSGLMGFMKNDVIKYAPDTLKMKILACIDSIPRILAKENKSFMYSEVEHKAGYGSREYDSALDWLISSGIALRCPNLNSICEPLVQNERADSFKIYLFDQGLLTHMYGRETAAALSSGDVLVNRGALMESITAAALTSSGFDIRFYSKKDSMLRTDFVISYKGMMTALDVKSGRSKRSKSLRMLTEGEYGIDRGIKISSSPAGTDGNGIVHLPLFAPSFFRTEPLPEIGMPDAEGINGLLRDKTDEQTRQDRYSS